MKVGTILEQWLACRHGARCSEVKQAAPADTMLAAFEVKQVVSARVNTLKMSVKETLAWLQMHSKVSHCYLGA